MFPRCLTNVTTGGTVVATYTYNALAQRIGVKDSGTQTWTIYDGQSADASPYADFNDSGNLTVRYLSGMAPPSHSKSMCRAWGLADRPCISHQKPRLSQENRLVSWLSPRFRWPRLRLMS